VVTDGFVRALLATRTLQPVSVDQGPTGATIVGAAADHEDIPINYGAIILRLLYSTVLVVGTWWILARNNVLTLTIITIGAVFSAYLSGRILIGRGPGLILSSSGISVRRGLGYISDLSWRDVTSVELKSSYLYSLLVIGVRDPQTLMANARGYRAWAMRQNAQRFGSPVTVFVTALKCDRAWLLQTACAYRHQYGANP
jgi:hypothetical protein